MLRIERDAFGPNAWSAALFDHYVHPGAAVFLVARLGRSIAGYAVAELYRATVEIDSIAVHSRYRRRGVALALFRAVRRWARQVGANRIGLMVRPDNEPALTFYRELGFTRIRTVARYYEDGSAGLRMRFQLE